MSYRHQRPLLALLLCAGTAAAQYNFDTHDLRLDVGSPGEWNDQDVLNPVVLDTEVFTGFPHTMYYCGHGGPFSPGPERWIIGVARSTDGVTWHRYPTALLGQGPPGAWDDTGRIHISVVETPGAGSMRFRMYYSCSDGPWASVATKTQIGLATSGDGLTFTKLPMPVLPVGPPGSWDAAAVFACGVMPPGPGGSPFWRMWYTGFSARPGVPGATAGIGYAWSPDGITWIKAPSAIAALPAGDPGAGYAYLPRVQHLEGKYRMWLTKVDLVGGAGPIRSVHYLTSPDGHLVWDAPYQPHGVLRYCHEAFPQWDSAASELRLWFVEQGGGGVHPIYGVPYDNIRVAKAPIHRDHPDEPYLITGTAWHQNGPMTLGVSDPRVPGGLGLVFLDAAINAPTASTTTPFGILALNSPVTVGVVLLDSLGNGQYLQPGFGSPLGIGVRINFQAAVLDPARTSDILTNPMTVPLLP